MDILAETKKTILKFSMLREGDRVLVGLSGGPDSVCLLDLLGRLREEYRLSLYSIYIDHGFRPGETPAEAGLARGISEKYGAEFYLEKVDAPGFAAREGMNRQEAARLLRYGLYDAYVQKLSAKVALGHTADDQVETFIMRLLRGSGPKGLSAIPAVRGKVIRPLIEVRKKEILEYLSESGIGYATDSSNLKQDYFRNRVRQTLIPALRALSPGFEEAVLRTAEILSDEERYFESLVLKALMRMISRKNEEEIELFLVPLENLEQVILRRTLRKAVELTRGLRGFEFGHIEDTIRLVKTGRPGDRLYLPRGIRVIKKYSTLLITSRAPAVLTTEYELPCPGEARLSETGDVITSAILEATEPAPEAIPGKRKEALLALEKLHCPLKIRAWRPGDFFCPEGFVPSGKRKKLQDFFVDEKVPRDERGRVPLVLSGSDIAWVAGMRADERFSARGSAGKKLLLKLKPGGNR